jgi:cell division protein FtsN
LDLNYTWYDKNQKTINYNYREERKATLSIPLKIAKFSTYQRFSVYQIVLPSSNYTTAEWLFSGSLAGVSTNLTTYGLFVDHNNPYLYSNLSLALRLPGGFVFMPQAQYGYSQHELISAKLAVEKHLLEHAFLNLSYEQIFSTNLKMTELGFRYDFSFAQTGASIRQSGKTTTLVQYARGSLINDRKTKYLGTDNRTNVGKGGISIVSYLDLNSNGRKDAGEPKVYGLKLRANGGRVEKSERDSTIRILGLEPYTSCFIELDPNSFENVSWRLPKQTLSVTVDPNILKLIEIPVTVVGEATGIVTLENEGERKGLGRIIVSFLKENQNAAGRALTEDNGYFSYFGLAPGRYTVRIDTTQLKKLGMISDPESRQFNIAAGIDGDIESGLDFILRLKPGDTTGIKTAVHEKPVIKKDTSYLIVHEVTQELVTISEDSYAIQMGAFKNKANAEAYRKKIAKILGKPVEIIIEDDFYKVRISNIKERKEVDEYISVLHQNGVNEVWVISLKAKHQQLVLKEKQDTITTITEKMIENALVTISPEMLVQLGAFRQESNALALRNRVSAGLPEKVIIVYEGGYYKVRLAGIPIINQTVIEEMKKLEGSIGKLGLKDFWILPFKKQPVEEPPVLQREAPPSPVVWQEEVPFVVKPQTTLKLKEEKMVVKVAPPEPTISLQVGVFHKQSEALRAQRRITTKLKLTVEIVKQYDYYHVIITGFFTREETYKYYPELAGLGYPSITLIENK